jgi:FKBP-type peptidyl-prolyl cis-trans isomerase FkpA/FKBP-type peptidyl-prolyl cis-trans isomerase FklB
MKALLVITSLLTVFSVSCNRKTSVKTDIEKYSYSIGYQFAKNLQGQSVDIDPDALSLAVEDVIKKKDPKITEEEMQKAMQVMYESRREKLKVEGEANLKKGKEFLEANKSKEGVKTTASGLQYKVLTEGSGPKASADDTVVVHYKGTLTDGTEFDSSYSRNQPAEFPVKAVIPGWTEALQLMNKGSKYELYIPSELAYGERGRPSIPPHSVLVFQVELLEIKKAK